MLDRHSEIIAHFIGQFDQLAEQSLFRQQYDAFRAQQRPDDEPGQLLDVRVRVSSDLPADKHIAGGINLSEKYVAHRADPAGVEVSADQWTWDVLQFATTPIAAEDIAVHYGFPADPIYIATTPVFDLSPPGSIITFAYQQNTAQDHDILLVRPLDLTPDLAESRSDAALNTDFMALAATADALTPGNFTLARETADTATRIDSLRDTYAGVDPQDAPEGAQVTLVSQQDGTLPESGILVDGAAADSLPDTLDTALDDRGFGATGEDDSESETDGETDEDDPSDGVVIGTIEIGPDGTGPYQDAMQLIEAGNNLLMNNAVAGLAPVDAPLIAVGGQAVSLTIISQVNVLSDRDTLVGPDDTTCAGPDHPFQHGVSEGHNIASVQWEGATWGSGGDGSGDGPLGFAITEIEGDLVITTHVFQLNLISDNDIITFETTFHQVEIGTGGNVSVDVLNALGFQTGFDMILVGGDMLNLVSMSQLNMLFDNDLLVDGDGVGADMQTSGNLLWNEAQITWHGIDTAADEMSEASGEALETMAGGQLDLEALKGEALLEGKEVPLLLTIGGNLVFDYRLEQINILADADTVQLFADAAQDYGLNPVDVAIGDNLLANVASLDIHGTDSTIMAEDGVFSDLVIHQAGMYDTDDTPLDPENAGSDLASEAVVFLADGMIDDGSTTVDAGGGDVIVDGGGGSGTYDTLGGVVA